jgi:methyl-accepting chemotaxis protein
MKLTIGQKVLLGYGLALTFLAGIAIPAYRSTTHLVDNVSWVTHTYVVLGETETMLVRLAEAESATRGYVMTGESQFLATLENASKLIAGNQKALRDLTADNASQQRRLDVFGQLIDRKSAILQEAVDARRQKGFAAASQAIQQSKAREATDAILKLVTAFQDEERRLLQLRNQEAAASAQNTTQVILYGSLLGFLSIALVGFAIHRSIIGPLDEFQKFVTAVGQGDLTQSSAREGNDELGGLARGLNQMVGGLRDVASRTRAAIENLNSATAEILASAKQQAAGTGEQASACQETNATMQEVSQSAVQIAEWAKQVAAAAEAASKASDAGVEAVQKTKQTVEAIREQSEAVAGNVVTLSEKTQQAGDIIATVNDIAEQSHLLALNAAIEAAAAGEHGRSFSVVAGEIKNLADQSKEATIQVKAILGAMQKGINTSVMLTEEAVKRVEVGKQQADVAAITIKELTSSVALSVQAFQQIVAGTNQQQIGFENVLRAVKDIGQASEQTASSTRQLEKAAANLTLLGQQLQKTTDRYKM